jgi:hypothetical protein
LHDAGGKLGSTAAEQARKSLPNVEDLAPHRTWLGPRLVRRPGHRPVKRANSDIEPTNGWF